MRFNKWLVLMIIIVLFASYLVGMNLLPSNSAAKNNEITQNEFVGNQQCQGCHKQQHADWQTSDHYKAMLPASDSTVLGDFNNAVYSADGVTSRFYKKGSDYYINTEGPDGENHDYKVLYTFGYYPLQQYLIAFPGGRMQVPRVSWDAKKNQWFHQYAHQKISPHDWLHWTGAAQNWNTMCASCHSTNLQKNYNVELDSFHTTYSSINVTCESCHGPGKKHVAFMNSEAYKKGKKIKGYYINLVQGQLEQINSCAPCHALKSDITNEQVGAGEMMDHYIPQIPTNEHFYADGQIKGEVYIYASFLQSKMAHRGVKCSNCHNPHTGKILFASNQLCLQCHSKTYDSPSHHFHQVGTKGAECKSCHMPGETYMGNDYRHDHSFRVPRPDLSAKYGIPNACNKCHSDQSSQWAAGEIERRFGSKRAYHFAEDLVPGSKLERASEVHLLKLLRDTATPDMIKATVVFYLGSIYTPTSVAALRSELQNKSALIRFNVLRSLANFPASEWQNAALYLLSDKVRAVRIAAADLFLTIPVEQIGGEYLQAFVSAKEDLRKYLYYQADYAEGNVMLGDHYLKQQDYEHAQKFYLRALKKDSLLNYTRLNLSVAYSATGKNAEALKVLKTAAAITPKNDRIFYNLGLLYIELKDSTEALKSFEKGAALKSTNPRLYYNYGLLLFHRKQKEKADEVLRKGLAISPRDGDLRNALNFIRQP